MDKGGAAPTITDAALAIGILAPDRFLGGRIPLDRDLAITAFESHRPSFMPVTQH